MTTEEKQILTTFEEQRDFVEQALVQAEKHRKKKEYRQGISLLVEALRYGIDKAQIYYRLGNIYIDGDDFNRAEYAYKRALDVDPHHVNAMHNLAIVYKRQKKVSLFVKTYKKAQRMEIRYPRKTQLDTNQKRHLRRLSVKIMTGMLALGGLIALVMFFAWR
ncbi:tetratricopeptide repeat protein [Candidatus Bipolaricaulota bacterium]|nr:tetratricopeptide repeat protein [Candidatus Bipolaricaulota bacterium]HHR85554.1 tetratricopeptide repeat protein [Candidatus Acetothermia bacterium]